FDDPFTLNPQHSTLNDPMAVPTDLDYAHRLDAQDELREFRNRFVIDDQELSYLDGNSLGRLPKESLVRAETLVRQEWGQRLVRAWNEHWFRLPERVGAKIGQLVGASEDEILVADSTSVNLFKLALAALHTQATQRRGFRGKPSFSVEKD